MSNTNFLSGHRLPVVFQGIGGAAVLLNVKGWSFDEDGAIFDVSNTGHGGRTARIAGKADTKGTVNADFDADVPPYINPPAIRFGTVGIIAFFVTPTKAVQIPVIVTKVHYEASMESEEKYSFDVGENVIVGVVVYPATPG